MSVVSGEDFESPCSSKESVIEDEAEVEETRMVSRPSCSKRKGLNDQMKTSIRPPFVPAQCIILK